MHKAIVGTAALAVLALGGCGSSGGDAARAFTEAAIEVLDDNHLRLAVRQVEAIGYEPQ